MSKLNSLILGKEIFNYIKSYFGRIKIYFFMSKSLLSHKIFSSFYCFFSSYALL